MAAFLDFEKPVEEILIQIDEARAIGEKSNVDVSQTIAELEKKLNENRIKKYKKIKPWQREQV
jgi:acetyl-CoA carboxylase carboxyl transferase subunit alpha